MEPTRCLVHGMNSIIRFDLFLYAHIISGGRSTFEVLLTPVDGIYMIRLLKRGSLCAGPVPPLPVGACLPYRRFPYMESQQPTRTSTQLSPDWFEKLRIVYSKLDLYHLG